MEIQKNILLFQQRQGCSIKIIDANGTILVSKSFGKITAKFKKYLTSKLQYV